MRQKFLWFKALPFGLALRLFVLYVVRRMVRIQVGFTFSEFAEDAIINHFPLGTTGTYVDVGCNEPVNFSNTFNLYLQGWRGINIDANRELIEKCKKIRKEDICVCAAVSDQQKETHFYKAKNPLISSIDEDYVSNGGDWWISNLDAKETVTTQTLTSILDKELAPGSNIDFLSIDVEGHDFKVLKSLDLSRYRPKVIIIELRELDKLNDNEINKYLIANNYLFKGYSVLTAYYVDKSIS